MTQKIREIVDYFHLDVTETSTHLHNVQQLTKRFLTRIPGVTKTYADAVVNASLLHDIGKASIPAPILYKKGSLDENERLIVETHPITGNYLFAKVLGKIDFCQTPEERTIVEHVILYHHERWDGTGYPHGLKEEDIPLESRIITIVDVFDALTSERSYKPAWTTEEALQYLEQEKGKIFDPTLVTTFIKMVQEEA